MSDSGLLQLSAAGDARAFGVFAERHGSYLLNLLRRFGLDPADAEDTAQQTFIKAYRSAGRYTEDRAAARTWLSTIALNLARNAKRGAGRRAAAYGRYAEEQVAVTRPRPVEELAAERRRERLRAALTELTDEQRAVLLLRLDAGMGFAEIGTELGISPAAAKQRFHRASRALRAHLTEDPT